MKCIKCIKVAKGYELDEIRRIGDVEAEERVKGGYWKYVAKSEWKALRKPTKAEVVVEQSADVAELSIEEKKLKRKKQK